ncbi:MAG: DUF1566 domain-containing protein [Nitrospinae bacterium]|nr:DUF1566 domain-containing protein [Nitrospinota bacterium]
MMSQRLAAVWGRLALAVFLVTISSGPVQAEETVGADPQKLKEDKTDYEFGGQILTLTEPQTEVVLTSDNPRFQDNQNGTVTDLETQLIWVQLDSYQIRKQWINWHKAQNYICELNETQFGGAANWRLPTRKELAGLFDENQSISWNYYWTRNEVHIDPIFGKSHCCYWTSEEHKEDMAWGYNYIRGKSYVSMKGGIQHSLSVIRAVRDSTDAELARK